MFISFALDNDVSLRCVLGLPTLLALAGIINLMKGDFVCSKINRTFYLTLDPLGKGLLEGIVFDTTTPTILQEVSTNIKPNPSLFHYTSADNRALICSSPSYSECIVVHDKRFKGDMSREFEYAPC